MYVLKYQVDTPYKGSWKEYPYEEVIDVRNNIALCQAETSKMYLEYRGFKAIGVIDNATQLQPFLEELDHSLHQAEAEEKRPPLSYKDLLQPRPVEAQPVLLGAEIQLPTGPEATIPSDGPKWWKD